MTTSKNGKQAASEEKPVTPDPEVLKKLSGLRTHVREGFGKIAMSMMALPRYRHQSIADLQHLVLDPLLRDRVAMAYSGQTKSDDADVTALAIWASVSEEVDVKIREQVRAGTFPIRLKADEWNSGDINWLFDVIAPDQTTTARVLANFRQVVKQGDLRLHPIVAKLVDDETLQKMAAGTPAAGEAVQ